MPLNLLSRFQKRQPVVVVSGLPRSGTSMMMQILQAGGLEIVTDHERSADADNPKGYYEFERVKKLKDGDTAWVKEAQGKGVKVISALLEYLPASSDYKIIFMHRNVEEILASQKQMLIRRDEATDKVEDQTLAEYYHAHLNHIQRWLADQPNMQMLYIKYNNLVNNPPPHIESVVYFLDMNLDLKAMLEVPDQRLYRQKS